MPFASNPFEDAQDVLIIGGLAFASNYRELKVWNPLARTQNGSLAFLRVWEGPPDFWRGGRVARLS